MSDKKRAWIYIRTQMSSVAYCLFKCQQNDLWQSAVEMGYTVAGISFDYADSNTPDRTGLAEVTQAAQQNQFDVLFVSNFNRLWRDTEQLAVYLCQFQALGLDVYSLKEGSASEHKFFSIQNDAHGMTME